MTEFKSARDLSKHLQNKNKVDSRDTIAGRTAHNTGTGVKDVNTGMNFSNDADMHEYFKKD